MEVYKVVGRYKEREEQKSWCRGKPNTQAKKRVYISKSDFLNYSPKLIKRWTDMFNVEVYQKIDNGWLLLPPKEA